MSRSKGAARRPENPAPRKRSLFRSPTGGLRGGWLLAASLLCYALVAVGLRWALLAGFAALFRAWGVNAETAHLAPGWARLLFRWHGAIASALVALGLIALCAGLRKLWAVDQDAKKTFPVKEGRYKAVKVFSSFGLLGLSVPVVATLVALVFDSVRPEWPLSAPRFTLALVPLLAVSLLSALASETFVRRVLYDGVKPRWGAKWAAAIAVAAYFVAGSGWAGNAIGAVNVALMGLMGCAVYALHGLWASVGLRFGWSAAATLLLGFGGGDAAVYRFYGVSEALLTGGDAGPACGVIATLLMIAVFAWLGWRYGLYTFRIPGTTRTSNGRSS